MDVTTGGAKWISNEFTRYVSEFGKIDIFAAYRNTFAFLSENKIYILTIDQKKLIRKTVKTPNLNYPYAKLKLNSTYLIVNDNNLMYAYEKRNEDFELFMKITFYPECLHIQTKGEEYKGNNIPLKCYEITGDYMWVGNENKSLYVIHLESHDNTKICDHFVKLVNGGDSFIVFSQNIIERYNFNGHKISEIHFLEKSSTIFFNKNILVEKDDLLLNVQYNVFDLRAGIKLKSIVLPYISKIHPSRDELFTITANESWDFAELNVVNLRTGDLIWSYEIAYNGNKLLYRNMTIISKDVLVVQFAKNRKLSTMNYVFLLSSRKLLYVQEIVGNNLIVNQDMIVSTDEKFLFFLL